MALAIIDKINKIRKKEDKIGLTNKIKNGITKVIILLTFYFFFILLKLILFLSMIINVLSILLKMH